jgi:hypothetical protein
MKKSQKFRNLEFEKGHKDYFGPSIFTTRYAFLGTQKYLKKKLKN